MDGPGSSRQNSMETELGESQKSLATLAENVPVGIFRVDRLARLSYANRACSLLAGLPMTELSGGEWISAVHPDDRVRVQRDFVEAAECGKVYRSEHRLRRPDGTDCWVAVHAVPDTTPEGVAAGLIGMAIDVTARHQAQKQVREAKVRLQALSRWLLESEEAQRRHLSRELHDEIGQLLTGIGLNLRSAISACPAVDCPPVRESLSLIEQTIGRVRDIALDLRPSMLDDLGLAATIQWFTARHALRANLLVELQLDPVEPRPSPPVETACFRIFQEALTNVLRHARARKVSVRLHCVQEWLFLDVADDGAGFEVEAVRQRAALGSSVGILGMEERAQLVGGTLEFHSKPGRGTRIEARVPLDGGAKSRPG